MSKDPTATSTDPNAQMESLPPCNINPNALKDEATIKQAQETINKWTEDIQKDVSQILEKYGVKVYELTFIHEGTRTPILLYKGHSYYTCRLAVHAAKLLKAQVDKELSIEPEG